MIRTAKISDVRRIQALIKVWADEEKMLHRPLNDIYEQVRDFLVYEEDGELIGAVALHVVWEGLAEIRSLVVDKRHEKRGIGASLLKRTLEEARRIGVSEVFVLTYVPIFFTKRGFHIIDKQTLPHKIWNDCVRCHKFPDCDETAVALTLKKND